MCKRHDELIFLNLTRVRRVLHVPAFDAGLYNLSVGNVVCYEAVAIALAATTTTFEGNHNGAIPEKAKDAIRRSI